jgi:OHCU decarboxylase
MAGARPFSSLDTLLDTSDRICSSLDRADWLEAFAAHPRIGDGAGGAGGAGTAGGAGGAGTPGEAGTAAGAHTQWSADEQSGVADDSRARLLALNRDYEERFGYIFIICATGKSGHEMLRALERRIGNNPDAELGEAAEEQRRIARLRLAKLLQ